MAKRWSEIHHKIDDLPPEEREAICAEAAAGLLAEVEDGLVREARAKSLNLAAEHRRDLVKLALLLEETRDSKAAQGVRMSLHVLDDAMELVRV